MDLLHANGIAVDLATATASPPPWLGARHPEILPVTRTGETMWPGARQHWRPTSPVFRQHALAVVEAMASRYADHPALAAWHVSNELGCHNLYDYSDDAAAAFRAWLSDEVRHARRAQPRLGHGVLVAALQRLGPGPAAAAGAHPSPTPPSSWTSSGSPPTP